MAVSYNKLWKMLLDRNMNKTDMLLKAGISTKTLAKLGKNQNVTTDVLGRICKALNCNVDDIMEFVEN